MSNRSSYLRVGNIIELDMFSRYLNSIGPVNNIPIGEAMVAYRDKSGDEDSSQTFVPFVAVGFFVVINCIFIDTV